MKVTKCPRGKENRNRNGFKFEKNPIKKIKMRKYQDQQRLETSAEYNPKYPACYECDYDEQKVS